MIRLTGKNLLDSKISMRYERDFVSKVLEYCDGDSRKVLVLQGLRRTGKTYGMVQAIRHLVDRYGDESCAFITCGIKDSMDDLYQCLEEFRDTKVRYIFVDEITFIRDFMNQAYDLANGFTYMGFKIVIAGTYSFAFNLASKDSLYDRCEFVNTSNISFKEFQKITGSESVQDFIKFGGLLHEGSVGNPFTERGFYLLDGIREYVDTAVVENLVNSLIHYKDGWYGLGYTENEMHQMIRSYVYSVVIDRLHRQVDGAMKYFDSLDANTAINNLVRRKELVREAGQRLKEEISQEFQNVFRVQPDMKCPPILRRGIEDGLTITGVLYPAFISQVTDEGFYKDSGLFRILNPIILRTSISDCLVSILNQLDADLEVIDAVKQVCDGNILEEVIRYEMMLAYDYGNVFTLQSLVDRCQGEIDLCAVKDGVINLYEVKNSSKMEAAQAKHLLNSDVIRILSERYSVRDRVVLYNGRDNEIILKDASGCDVLVKYRNISQFLSKLEYETGSLNSRYLGVTSRAGVRSESGFESGSGLRSDGYENTNSFR